MQRGSSMPTPPYFTSKLPVGHGILVALRPALIGILRAHPLLSPVHDVAVGGIQACREQCAVMLWIDSGALHPCRAEAIDTAGAHCRLHYVGVAG